MDKYGRQVGLSSGGSFGVRFTEHPVAVLRVAVVASNPAGLELVRIPSASLLFLLENSGVVVAGANEVYREAVRSGFKRYMTSRVNEVLGWRTDMNCSMSF